jgi:signal transduction histidine kinase
MAGNGSRFSAAYGYAVALFAVVAAMAIRLALNPILGAEAPYLFFLVAILLVGQLKGRGPALLATAISALTGWWYFLEARHSFAPANPLTRLAIFTVVGVVVSVFTSHARALLISSFRSEASLRKQLELLTPPESLGAAQRIVKERNGRAAGTDSSLVGKLKQRPHFIWLGFAFLLLLLQTGLSLQVWTIYADREQRTIHTHLVLEKLGLVFSTMTDAEAAQRGYLLTGIDAYLEPYDQSLKEIPVQLEELQKLTADNPRQQSNEGKLRSLVVDRLAQLADAVTVRRTAGLLPAVQIVDSNHGKQTMDQIHTILDAMEAEELSLLGRRNKAVIDAASVMIATMVGATGLLLLVLLAGSRTIDRHINREREAHEALLDAQVRLANRDKEELREAVETRTAELRVALGDLEQMSYSMVHDMRAPLRAMRGFAQLVEEEYPGLGGEGLDYLRRIQAASERLDQLITDALDYTKVARQELPLAPVDLASFLREMIDTYPNLQSTVANIDIGFQELVVVGNKSLLTQCFSNLLGNAVKFVTPEDRPEVRVCTEPRGDAVRIWVEDHGIGIPREAHQRIFEMFQRMHHQDEYPGTGIGLTTVRKAVERMGGQVGVESEPGVGSRFWVELKSATSNTQSPREAASHRSAAEECYAPSRQHNPRSGQVSNGKEEID